MRIDRPKKLNASQSCEGFALEDVVMSIGIAAISMGGIVSGYVFAAQQAEWSVFSTAGQSLAIQRLEQTRAAKWDASSYPPVDELVSSNFPVAVADLNVPNTGTNTFKATNTTTITSISTNPPLKLIRVDCTWRCLGRGPFTNTVVSYRGPD